MINRRTFIGALGAAATARPAIAACELEAPSRIELRIGLLTERKSFDPMFARGDDAAIARNIHGGLFEYRWSGAAWTLEPRLAESFELNFYHDGNKWIIDDSNNEAKVTVALREGTTFAGGAGLTADAVLASYRRQSDVPRVREHVKELRKTDEHRFEIVLQAPIGDVEYVVLGPMVSTVVDADFAQREIADPDQSPAWDQSVPTSGAYAIVDYRLGERLKIGCRQDDWRAEKSFREVLIRDVPTLEAALAALKSRELDILGPFHAPRLSSEMRRMAADPDIEMAVRQVAASYVIGSNGKLEQRDPDGAAQQATVAAIRSMPFGEDLAMFADRPEGMFPP